MKWGWVKGAALITPLILSIVLLVAVCGKSFAPIKVNEVILQVEPAVTEEGVQNPGMPNEASEAYAAYREELRNDYVFRAEQLENQFNILMAVIGIAVTTWIGLNVYNIAEKKQVDELAMKAMELEQEIIKSQKKLKELEQELNESVDRILENEKAIEEGIPARFS